MIGGRFKLASVASVAAAGLFMGGVAAQAADLGGNCCADLEERVAELEATTARKGNRKVSLEVSGHVHEAIVHWDVDTPTGANEEENVYIGTHNSSRSRFRFKGSAKIDADWSAGFLMEFGVRANHLGGNSQAQPYTVSGLDIRHEALYVQSKRLGTVWLGWTSSAADGITEICLGCGLGNGPDYSDDMGDLVDGNGDRFDRLGGRQGAFVGEGDRREVIRYISPTIAGFVISGAYGQDDFYDASLRYAGEFGSIRIAGGVAYQRDTTDVIQASVFNGNGVQTFTDANQGFISRTACNANNNSIDCEMVGASLSMQHTPTGLYIAGAYGRSEEKNDNSEDNVAWHVTAGINTKWSSLGNTNIWGMYTQADSDTGPNATSANGNVGGDIDANTSQLRIYGVGIEQGIDAAAMSLYVYYKHFEGELSNVDSGSMDQVVAGALIRF